MPIIQRRLSHTSILKFRIVWVILNYSITQLLNDFRTEIPANCRMGIHSAEGLNIRLKS